MSDTQKLSDGRTRAKPVSEAELAARIDTFFAQEFEVEAARLNERIARVEAYLASLKWKCEVTVSGPEGHTLSFARNNGQWALYWNESSGLADFAAMAATFFQTYQQIKQGPVQSQAKAPEKQLQPPPSGSKKLLLRDASIEAKARATALLAQLVEKLQAAGKTRRDAIVTAQSNLDAVERLLMNATVKEGI